MSRFSSVKELFIAAAGIFQKPDRLTVTEVAERDVIIRRLGSRSGHWDRTQTPYMVEPQNLFSSRELEAIIFCGPSQTGKTEGLILNTLAYSVIQDPMDTIIYSPTQNASRDFSVRRIDRLNFNSPAMRERLMKTKTGDNKQVKIYSSGMILSLSWPTVSEMAGKPVGRIMMTDYDRMGESIGDEGSPFDLAAMRATTFGSLSMTVAESSPSRPVTDLRWIAATPHEAPPTTGILALYNRGDRRRWYWPHFECGYYFEGKFEHLKWEEKPSSLDAADTVRMICPVCGGAIRPDERSAMQERGIWLKDGQSVQGNWIIGDGPRTKFASFWLNGVAAGFQTWPELVVKFINATQEYDKTGSEEALRQFHNNDIGEPYRPKSEELERLPEILAARAEPMPPQEIPADVRALVAAIDVQKNCFVVQVHGISPGVPYDITIIDRFSIFKSNRVDEDGDRLWVKPGTNQEDWDRLTEEVLLRTYPLSDGSERRMMIKMTVCDSGGREGVTTNAYTYYRKLRNEGLAPRFHLVRGNPLPSSPRTYISFPDSRRRDRLAAAKGDVPVMFLNPNMLKDALNNRLESITPGNGMIRFPNWLEPWFFRELCAERRTEKGWKNTQGTRNEAWDLMYYCIGVCASPLLRIEQIDWQQPPSWADEWNKNPLVVANDRKETLLTQTAERDLDFASLGKALA